MKKQPVNEITVTQPPAPNISYEESNLNLKQLINLFEETLTPHQIQSIKEIGYAIGKVGASLKDAAFLARVTKNELDEWIAITPEIKIYLDLKRTDYKFRLLEIVSNQVIENKDVKLATQLLELQFAEEFNPQVKKEMAKLARSAEEDVMDIAISIVRRGAAHTVPVNPDTGNADVDEEVVKYHDVKEILE
jgi:hypothetical protein